MLIEHISVSVPTRDVIQILRTIKHAQVMDTILIQYCIHSNKWKHKKQKNKQTKNK